MLYPLLALISVTLFALVHLFAEKIAKQKFLPHAKILSIGGGLALSYVFIDLLPKLAKNDLVLQINSFAR